MSIKPIKAPVLNSEEFEMVPAGVYLARCYRMIDIGTHTIETKQNGAKDVHQVILSWELLQDDDDQPFFMSDGEKVFTINKTYTLSMHKKSNLRADLDSWRGIPFTDEEASDFDITKLLDVFCKLQVIHNSVGDKTYANVKTIMTTRKKTTAINEAFSFSLVDRDMEVFENFSDYLKSKITSSFEWEGEPVKTPDNIPTEEDVDKPIDLSEIPF